jgi:predicted ATPase/class 3 adenylate cyclase
VEPPALSYLRPYGHFDHGFVGIETFQLRQKKLQTSAGLSRREVAGSSPVALVLWNPLQVGNHEAVSPGLPSSTVTLLFTDIEGSTRLLHELGADAYAEALSEHRRLLRGAFAAHRGVEVDTQGDAFFVAFPNAPDAVAAARAAQEALGSGPIQVRIGLHTGTPKLAEEGYVGADVHLGARIAAAGHGGQVLLSKATRELVDGAVSDLGEHRLKDFAEPVWLYQLGQERFPPLKTISNTNLPRPASSFVGREREVSEVVSLLQDGARLVTLAGPGGSGKTRLAIEAAAELVPEFRNGVFWVGLAALRDPALVTETVAQTLGAKDGLAEHIGERELLLLLDNFEQVVEAAPELASLLEACRNLQLLVTSRELLRVRGEVKYGVRPLSQPEAVDLFSARSQLEPDQTIAELCTRLDNLPLAVELAAARTSVLSPTQILDRLAQRLDLLKGGRDTEARQQTLRATIAWSYEILSEEEQQLFARLAVFTGGCTLDAAEQVVEADLDALQALVDKSLLRHTGDRLWMLETIREYAAERLEESTDAREMRRRHAEFFLARAQEAEPHLRAESREWLDRLEREQDNLRAALDELEASDESELLLELAGAAWWLWSLRGPVAEARRRLERALAADPTPTIARAKALIGAADLTMDTGDHAMTRFWAEEALALCRTLGDAWGAAYCLLGLGLVFASEDAWSEAQPLFAESVRLFREVGDEHWAQQTSRRLAWSYEELGDLERARALHEEGLRWARASGDEFIKARSLAALAQYTLDEGRIDEAIPLLAEVHRIHRDRPDQPDRYWDAVLLCRFAQALAMKGRADTAVRLLSSFDRVVEEIEGPRELWVTRMNDATLARAQQRLDDAAIAAAWEHGQRLMVDEAVALALSELEAARATAESEAARR